MYSCDFEGKPVFCIEIPHCYGRECWGVSQCRRRLNDSCIMSVEPFFLCCLKRQGWMCVSETRTQTHGLARAWRFVTVWVCAIFPSSSPKLIMLLLSDCSCCFFLRCWSFAIFLLCMILQLFFFCCFDEKLFFVFFFSFREIEVDSFSQARLSRYQQIDLPSFSPAHFPFASSIIDDHFYMLHSRGRFHFMSTSICAISAILLLCQKKRVSCMCLFSAWDENWW